MIVPAPIRRCYTNTQPFLLDISRRVEDTLGKYSRENSFVFEGRVKTLESVAEKVESGRYSSWAQLDDLYACTIAVPLWSDEKKVQEFVCTVFNVEKTVERGSVPKPPDAFRFDSTRIVARLRRPEGPDARMSPSVYDIMFEIQVKSLFEFAWAKTTHALTYKNDSVEWKRYRLAAHLKAAAEQADFLLAGFEQVSDLVPDGSSPDISDKSALRELFVRLVREERIPSEFVPKDWSRFVDNVYAAIQALAGKRPTGRGFARLAEIEPATTTIGDYFEQTGSDMIPRSLSLFQVVLGVLCASGRFDGKARGAYHVPADDLFNLVFDNPTLPGHVFASGD